MGSVAPRPTRSETERQVVAGLVLVAALVAPAQPAAGVGLPFEPLRVSDMGGTGDPDFDAFDPAVAYAPETDQFLVVWAGTEPDLGLAPEETEIFGQRIDAATRLEIGEGDVRISFGGGLGDPLYEAFQPAVTYNPAAAEYLVVWAAHDSGADPGIADFEIYGQRLAPDGEPVGGNFPISALGPTDEARQCFAPAVAFDPENDAYLVVWEQERPGWPGTARQIVGRRLDGPTGAPLDPELLISGVQGSLGAHQPDLVHSPEGFVVTWQELGTARSEVHAQRIAGTSGARIGLPVQVSHAGAFAGGPFSSREPAITYNSLAAEFLVAWTGSSQGLAAGEWEILVQRLDANLAPTGTDDARISAAGGLGDPEFGASRPRVAFKPTADEYLVVWQADDGADGHVDEEQLIFAQRLGGALADEIGIDDQVLADPGGVGDPAFGAEAPALALRSATETALVVRTTDDDIGGLVDDELEIFADFAYDDVHAQPFFSDGFESGDASAWN